MQIVPCALFVIKQIQSYLSCAFSLKNSPGGSSPLKRSSYLFHVLLSVSLGLSSFAGFMLRVTLLAFCHQYTFPLSFLSLILACGALMASHAKKTPTFAQNGAILSHSTPSSLAGNSLPLSKLSGSTIPAHTTSTMSSNVHPGPPLTLSAPVLV